MGSVDTTPTQDKALNLSQLKLWPKFHRYRQLLIRKRKLVGPETRIFTMGSCFATEVRRALVREGFKVYPDYLSIDFDQQTQILDMLPEREAIVHYDTFVMRQEFEAALGLWPDRNDSFWPVRDRKVNEYLSKDEVFQDPTRKLVYAATEKDLADLTTKIDNAIMEGILDCDVFVITLGLTEVWRNKATKKYLCRPPETGYGGGKGLAEFEQSTFSQNQGNMKAIFDLLFERYPEKQVILTVSPVPLGATYSNTDVGTANAESKSILRAVAGQICREFENVHYFPSYELATIVPGPVFKKDGRHVLPEFADRVIDTFLSTYSMTP